MPLSPSRKNSVALLAICLAALMFGLEISSVPAILPNVEKVLHAGFSSVQWIMNAYTIACTTVLMAAGTLADRYGRKRVLLISVISFGITSLICGLARDASVLIVSRFLQGMSGGFMAICQIAALSHQFQEGPRRSKAFAIWGIIFGVGLGFGPIIGSAIVALSNWTWVFLIQVPLTVVTLVLIAGSVDESRDPHAKALDLPGIVTLSLAVFGLTYFITQGPDLGFTSPTAIVSIVVAAISFLVFLYAEKHSAYPMFDFSVFRIRQFSGALYGSIGMNFSFWPLMIYLPIYFQSGLGYDVVASGLSLLAYTLPTLAIPPFAERLSLRYQPRIVIPAGLFAIGLGFVLMKFGSGVEHASWLTMLPGCLLAGIGLGMTNTPVTNTTTGSVPSARAGMASGIDLSARLITLAINIALMGFLLLEGILYYLERAAQGAVDASQLRIAAAKIAAGASPGSAVDISGAVAHAALVHGFGWVMLYGGIGAWILALASFITFGPAEERSRTKGICATDPA
ncbi:EmrB/QacA subfamily drug resistance transporter [Luteibacter rhizovicinus]|uniref:EmrB/QacA subfamily drug resistance transporter n=1 Tax=Luteibacter rhizovicinus TaxID=242606 RepID=A0A4R3YFY1_9GAMM|nr:MFS transporter [Luteibacter rhizovicinus]TCV91107.1 EmrB/QacA subfamily drug resistance transporter [Luteibacter rhizovicinus]